MFKFPSDFDHSKVKEYIKVFEKRGLIISRMVSGSKTGYTNRYPDNLVIFNANVIIKSVGKIWHGDLDLTFDAPILKQIADELDETLYVLYEMHARFGNENRPVEELIKKAVWSTDSDWEPTLANYLKLKGIKNE